MPRNVCPYFRSGQPSHSKVLRTKCLCILFRAERVRCGRFLQILRNWFLFLRPLRAEHKRRNGGVHQDLEFFYAMNSICAKQADFCEQCQSGCGKRLVQPC